MYGIKLNRRLENNRMKKTVTLMFFTAILLFTNASCSNEPQPVKGSQFLLDTVVEITLYEKEDIARKIIDELFEEIANSERKYSRHISDSEITKVNKNPGKPVKVSEDTLDMVKKSLEFSSLSEGLFDITVGPLVDLWDINGENPHIPTQSEIDSILNRIDYRKISVDSENITLSIQNEGMSIDTGAIAKGYITDRLVSILREKDINHALLNLGGNLYMHGSKPDGSDWNVGIRNPYGLQGDYIAVVSVKNMSVVTSGIYERYFESGGKRYHHILNPKTGYPEDNNLASVSILSASSATADGLSTTVFLLGLEDGMSLIEGIDGVEAIIVTTDRKVYVSSGIKNGKIPFRLINEEYSPGN